MTGANLNDYMRAGIVLLIFGFTGWVYHNNPREDIVIGAILASFTTAVGYYLGHAAGKAEAQRAKEGPSGNPGDPVHVEEER